jgi:hypothetical protein
MNALDGIKVGGQFQRQVQIFSLFARDTFDRDHACSIGTAESAQSW